METVRAIIDALGGNDKAAALAGVTPPAVSNWKSFDAIPARHKPKFEQELGVELPWACFGFKGQALVHACR